MESPNAARNLEIVLVHELSSGTFARLYLAEARAPGGIVRIVAVKILREQWAESSEILNRTRDEARLLARLRHRNILRVEDLAEIDGQLAIIMEFVDGLDLKQLIDALNREGVKAPVRAMLEICAATASALDAAHNRVPYGLEGPLHVVHRDIKPSNIMVSVEGEVKVLDFGTARSSQQRSAQTGALRFGSLKYMSPERREGDRGEIASDVYALGLTLLELLRADWLPLLPLDVVEHDEALATHITRLTNLGMPNADWDQALRNALLRMVAGDPAQRPPVAEVQKLLRAFADQASGPTLESFAQEHIARLTRAFHGDHAGGALSGTRFVVNVLPESPARAPQDLSAPRPLAPRPEPVRALPSEEDRPTSAATAADMSAPEDWGDEATVQRASPLITEPVAPPPAPPPVRPEPPAPAPAAPNNTMLWAGVAVFAVFIAVAVVASVLAAGYYVLGPVPEAAAPPRPATVQPAPAKETPAPGGGAEPADGAGVAFGVTVPDASPQWIHLDDAGGARKADGRESLTSTVPPGAYTLAVKVVGKPAWKGAVQVPAAGGTLSCAVAKEGGMTCTGLGAPITLLP